MRIENIKLFWFNSKKTRQIKTMIMVLNNLSDIAPNVLRINDLSLFTKPLLTSNNSYTKPIKTMPHPVIHAVKIGSLKPLKT